ncbi:hypothetical protein F4809DRAFT_587331 [Biscogniauxia mediterranea]|nr:hypothetical protein F4809DRAFT_587331 [Biscogniauxia mediterranea]
MASPSSIVRSPPTCLNCLRQLARPSPATLSLTQTRARTTKAELEDLQGIPVRLLRDIPSFGRKHAIIRVKPGRMRNIWFPKSAAEYMTSKRFAELGLTEAAIGVRDRSFGSKFMLEEAARAKERAQALKEEEDMVVASELKAKKKEVLTLPPEETQALLEDLLPETLVFKRKPIAAPAPEPVPIPEPEPVTPAVPRSPSLATRAATSVGGPPPPPAAASSPPTPPPSPATPVEERAIFGSVSANDILAHVKELLLVGDARRGSRVALDASGVEMAGLDDGEDRIKRLGTFEVRISAGRGFRPVKRVVSVVADE